jgi:hypothetical protein
MDRDALNALKPLLDSPFWFKFEELLQAELQKTHQNLETSEDDRKIARSQGKAAFIRSILSWKEQLKRKD